MEGDKGGKKGKGLVKEQCERPVDVGWGLTGGGGRGGRGRGEQQGKLG